MNRSAIETWWSGGAVATAGIILVLGVVGVAALVDVPALRSPIVSPAPSSGAKPRPDAMV